MNLKKYYLANYNEYIHNNLPQYEYNESNVPLYHAIELTSEEVVILKLHNRIRIFNGGCEFINLVVFTSQPTINDLQLFNDMRQLNG